MGLPTFVSATFTVQSNGQGSVAVTWSEAVTFDLTPTNGDVQVGWSDGTTHWSLKAGQLTTSGSGTSVTTFNNLELNDGSNPGTSKVTIATGTVLSVSTSTPNLTLTAQNCTLRCAQPTFNPASATGTSGITSGQTLDVLLTPDGSGTTQALRWGSLGISLPYSIQDRGGNARNEGDFYEGFLFAGSAAGFQYPADGSVHGSASIGWDASSADGSANDQGPARTFVFDLNYLPPTWDNAALSMTVGETTSTGMNLSMDGADAADFPGYMKLVYHPSLEVRSPSGLLVPNNAWFSINDYGGGFINDVGIQVKPHAHGSPTIIAYLAKDGSGTAASTGATLTITATLAVNPSLPTDAARVTAWDFGSTNSRSSEANGGKPGWQTIRTGVAWFKQIAGTDNSVAAGDMLCGDGQNWIGGIGPDRGITVHGYTGVCDYPGSTSIGDVSSISPYLNGDISFNGGITITPNAVSWLFVFSHTVRGTDSIGGEALACVLLRMNDVINLQADASNILQIAGTGVPGGTTNVTVSGKNQYAHAGRNAVCLIANGTSLYVITENGVSAPITITAGLSTFSIALCNLFNGAAGRSYSRGHYLLLSGAITTAKGQEYVNDFAKVRWGIMAKTKTVCWTGDSRSNRYLGLPGYTLAGMRATAHPTELVLNFAQAGAATLSGGAQSVIDLQLPRALAAMASFANDENALVHYGAANDILGSRTAAQINTDYTTLATAAHGAGAKFVCFTEPLFAPSHASDGNLTSYETVVRNLKTLLLANIALDEVVDLAGLFPLLRAASNTSTNIRNTARGAGTGGMDVQTYYRAPSAAVITAVLFVSAVGVATDGVHMGDDGVQMVYTMSDAPVTAALAASGSSEGIESFAQFAYPGPYSLYPGPFFGAP